MEKKFIPAKDHPAFAMMSSVTGKPKKKAKQSPTNALTDAIISFVKLSGFQAYRINTMGVFDEKLGRYRTSGMQKGLPDIIAIIHGHFVGIEVKTGADRMSEDQLKRKAEIEKSGGAFIIARNIDQCRNELITHINKFKG